jgi:molybdopterin converting factor small subunit
MVRRLTAPEVDPAAVAAAAAEAANAEAKMAIEVATAESAAAKLSAQQAREAHEAEIARIAEEAMLAAQEAARLSEEARIAAAAKAEADALAALNPAAGDASEEIEIQEGESLDEVKARMAAMKPKKQSISADLLNTANSYDDKVALIRMIVAEDSTRVAGVLKSLIRQ